MNLYNTLSKSVVPVEPSDNETYRVYSCGPTVYDRVHIGNLSSFIYADILHRTLAATGKKIKHVMNFTDVDDKTIRRSHEKFPESDPLKALRKLTEKYGELFIQDMRAVGNNVESMQFVKATEQIDEMKSLISELYTAKFAYLADDGIYFSIQNYTDSGKKYGQLTVITEKSTSEARIQNDEYDKESIHDFALWKKQRDNEPSWEYSVDGIEMDGRPGWHIECSAMSKAFLGQPFDIHTGGVDLIFPHHENEIAQSTAGEVDPVFATVFAHNEHLLIDGQKMSKSLQNFYTLEDITNKGFSPIVFRLLILQSHYRSQAHFSWNNMIAAGNRLDDLRTLAALRWQPVQMTHDAIAFALSDVAGELKNMLMDDLNTPAALSYLSDVSTQLQAVLINDEQRKEFTDMLQQIDQLLGLQLIEVADISKAQKELINKREEARKLKKWGESDAVRKILEQQHIGIRDTDFGPIWYPLSVV